MELLEEIKYSLEKQSRKQGKTLRPSSDRSYITWSINWKLTIEGHLFWGILHYTYRVHGIYDYITITKLYHVFGRDVFKYDIFIVPYYSDYFDKDTYTLTDEGFRLLCKEIEIWNYSSVLNLV